MGGKKRFEELEVERINVVGKDGKVKMTLAGTGMLPQPVLDGKEIGQRRGVPSSGIIFYNNEGDECGGLTFGSGKENGKQVSQTSISFDAFKQDQVLQISFFQEEEKRKYGVELWERPGENLGEIVKKFKTINEMPGGEEKDELKKELIKNQERSRMFMGRNERGESIMSLSDSEGKERIRMIVDEKDNPRIEVLDSQGNIVYCLPPGKQW